MVGEWTVRERSMTGSWAVHGESVESPWWSMVGPWWFYGLFMVIHGHGGPWTVHGVLGSGWWDLGGSMVGP